MDYKKTKAPTNTVTRDIMNLCEETGNIYESVVVFKKFLRRVMSNRFATLGYRTIIPVSAGESGIVNIHDRSCVHDGATVYSNVFIMVSIELVFCQSSAG